MPRPRGDCSRRDRGAAAPPRRTSRPSASPSSRSSRSTRATIRRAPTLSPSEAIEEVRHFGLDDYPTSALVVRRRRARRERGRRGRRARPATCARPDGADRGAQRAQPVVRGRGPRRGGRARVAAPRRRPGGPRAPGAGRAPPAAIGGRDRDPGLDRARLGGDRHRELGRRPLAAERRGAAAAALPAHPPDASARSPPTCSSPRTRSRPRRARSTASSASRRAPRPSIARAPPGC